MPSILVLGATGYVGAPLTKALKIAHPSWPITAFTRPSRSADAVKVDLGVNRVETGEFKEFDKIQALSKEHDIVVNAGSSFTPEPVDAIVAGLKERVASGQARGKLVQVSGGGNFIDFGTSGSFNPDSKVWNDGEDDIKLVNEKMFSGVSDTMVLKAGEAGEIDTYTMCPGIVYGGAAVASPTIGLGYTNIIGLAKGAGHMFYVGDGSAVVAVTHVVDAVNALVRIIERAATGPAEGSAYSRWYNVLTEERVAWKDIAMELARILEKKRVVKEVQAKSVSLEEAGDGPFKYIIASNLLMQGPNAVKMGFVASQSGILEQMESDLKDAKL